MCSFKDVKHKYKKEKPKKDLSVRYFNKNKQIMQNNANYSKYVFHST